MAERAGQLARLFAGVLLERAAVFDDFRQIRPARQVGELQSEIADDLDDLLTLLAIAGSENEHGHKLPQKVANVHKKEPIPFFLFRGALGVTR